jgi:ATP synthase subunit 6
MYTPFEQFRILIIKILHLEEYDISITNNVIMLITIALLIMTIHMIINISYHFKPNHWQYVIETIYSFVFSIVSEQSGKKGFKYFIHLYTIFGLILLYNLCGLVPFSFTVTSQVIITFTIALSYFLGWILIGVVTLQNHFIYVFCPRNMPLWLLPLLICVELLSFSLRPVSLGVRLFANMLAGHILLHILANAFTFLYNIALLLIIPAFFILSAITVLELGISCLQAYIFTILLAIYLKDSLVSHAEPIHLFML